MHSNTTTLLTGAGNGNGLDLASLRQMLQLNVMGVAGSSHRYGAQMKRLRPGRVLNVALSAASRLAPFFTAHGRSKALAVNFSDALAREIEDFGGRISGQSPDSTDTTLFDGVDPRRIAGWHPFGEANCADPRGSADLTPDGGMARAVRCARSMLVFVRRFTPGAFAAAVSKRLLRPLDPHEEAA